MPPPTDPLSYESPEGQRPAVSPSLQVERKPHDPYAAFRFGDFSLFTAGNLLSITGRLMLAVAVEWELYARTHSATALGLVGLVIAGPWLTMVASRLLARVASRPDSLVAARRLSDNPQAGFRQFLGRPTSRGARTHYDDVKYFL